MEVDRPNAPFTGEFYGRLNIDGKKKLKNKLHNKINNNLANNLTNIVNSNLTSINIVDNNHSSQDLHIKLKPPLQVLSTSSSATSIPVTVQALSKKSVLNKKSLHSSISSSYLNPSKPNDISNMITSHKNSKKMNISNVYKKMTTANSSISDNSSNVLKLRSKSAGCPDTVDIKNNDNAKSIVNNTLIKVSNNNQVSSIPSLPQVSTASTSERINNSQVNSNIRCIKSAPPTNKNSNLDAIYSSNVNTLNLPSVYIINEKNADNNKYRRTKPKNK